MNETLLRIIIIVLSVVAVAILIHKVIQVLP